LSETGSKSFKTLKVEDQLSKVDVKQQGAKDKYLQIIKEKKESAYINGIKASQKLMIKQELVEKQNLHNFSSYVNSASKKEKQVMKSIKEKTLILKGTISNNKEQITQKKTLLVTQ